jgi:hypothetical protein
MLKNSQRSVRLVGLIRVLVVCEVLGAFGIPKIRLRRFDSGPIDTAQAQESGTAASTPQCLDLTASANDQLDRAKADSNYSTCLDDLAKQQAHGCEEPTPKPFPTNGTQADKDAWNQEFQRSDQAYSDCLKNHGCDLACSRRADAFKDLALTSRAYHEAKQRCTDSQTPADCQQVQQREAAMKQAAQRLAGTGSHVF